MRGRENVRARFSLTARLQPTPRSKNDEVLSKCRVGRRFRIRADLDLRNAREPVRPSCPLGDDVASKRKCLRSVDKAPLDFLDDRLALRRSEIPLVLFQTVDFYSLDILPTLRPGALNWAQHSIDVVTPEIWVRIGEWPIVRDQPCLVFRGIDPGLQRADVKPNRHLRSPTCKSSAGPMPHLKYRLPSHPSSDAANQGRSIPVQHGSAYESGRRFRPF